MAGNFEPARVEAELVQHGGVDVGDVVAVFDGVEAELVGRAVGDAPLDAAAGHPDREAERMVVAAVGSLRAGRAAELGRPDDDRLVEQAALLQIGQQPGDRLVDLGALRGVILPQVAVGVPAPRRRRWSRGRSARSGRRARPAAAPPGTSGRRCGSTSWSRP